MGKFFNIDSPLMRFLTKLADLMILNIVFLITCIPVVTIGAAWTALYYVAMKMVRDEESGIVRSYLHSFRMNFRQATALWLGVVVVMALLVLDYLILRQIASPIAAAMNMGIYVLAMVMLMVLQYLFPLLAKFDTGWKQTVKNAVLLCIGQLPKTLLMVFSVVGAFLITIYNGYTLSIGILVWMLLGFAILAFSNSSILVKIFDSLIPGNQNSEKPVGDNS